MGRANRKTVDSPSPLREITVPGVTTKIHEGQSLSPEEYDFLKERIESLRGSPSSRSEVEALEGFLEQAVVSVGGSEITSALDEQQKAMLDQILKEVTKPSVLQENSVQKNPSRRSSPLQEPVDFLDTESMIQKLRDHSNSLSPISREEEWDLVERAQLEVVAGDLDSAFYELLSRNIANIHSLVARRSPPGDMSEDVFQEAVLGFIDGIKDARREKARGAPFWGFARQRVGSHVTVALRQYEESPATSVPKSAIFSVIVPYQQARVAVLQKGADAPPTRLLAEINKRTEDGKRLYKGKTRTRDGKKERDLDWNMEDVLHAQDITRQAISLDENFDGQGPDPQISEEGRGTMREPGTFSAHEKVSDPSSPDPVAVALAGGSERRVQQVLSEYLEPKEIAVVVLRLGLFETNRQRPRTFRECARVMGVSIDTAGQRYRNAIEKLHSPDVLEALS